MYSDAKVRSCTFDEKSVFANSPPEWPKTCEIEAQAPRCHARSARPQFWRAAAISLEQVKQCANRAAARTGTIRHIQPRGKFGPVMALKYNLSCGHMRSSGQSVIYAAGAVTLQVFPQKRA